MNALGEVAPEPWRVYVGHVGAPALSPAAWRTPYTSELGGEQQ